MKSKETLQGIINTMFNMEWYVGDFVSAFCVATGLNETELTEKEREHIIKKMVKNRNFPSMLNGLRQVIIEDVNERLSIMMSEHFTK